MSVAEQPHALRRALLRLLLVVALLLLAAGVPGVARSRAAEAAAAAGERAAETALRGRLSLLRDAVARVIVRDGALPDPQSWSELLGLLALPPAAGLVHSTGRIVDTLPAAADGAQEFLYCRSTGEFRANRPGLAATGARWLDV